MSKWQRSIAHLLLIAITAQSVTVVAHADPTPRAPGVPDVTLDDVAPQSAGKLREVLTSDLLRQRAADQGEAPMIEFGHEENVRLPVMDGAVLADDTDARHSEFKPITTVSGEAERAAQGLDSAGQPLPQASPSPKPDSLAYKLHRKLWFVTAELLGAQIATVALMSLLPDSVTHWGQASFMNIFKNFQNPPVFDNDMWAWNYITHPLAGSEYYLLARNRDATWWQSLLYSAGMSLFWEMVTEGFYERWSYQDLLITPIAGAVIGELRFQAKKAANNIKTKNKTQEVFKKILIVIIDPVDALTGGMAK